MSEEIQRLNSELDGNGNSAQYKNKYGAPGDGVTSDLPT
jgi:hypothetical protein